MNNLCKHLNIYDARSAYTIKHHNALEYNPIQGGNFSNYSPAYTLSNENLRWITGLTQGIAKRVLTTAGSGDQAMFYAINGATHIDTFDTSFCARVVQNIKTVAIQHLTHDQYIELLNELHKTGNAMQLPLMSNIIPHLSDTDIQFIRDMNNCKIFGNGLSPSKYPEYYPTPDEYKKMQQCISTQFPFIWSDVESLHKHLTGEYDIINVSNIFQYLNINQIYNVLTTLHKHLTVDGVIISSDSYNTKTLFNTIKQIDFAIKLSNAKFYAKPYYTVPRDEIFAVQRVR